MQQPAQHNQSPISQLVIQTDTELAQRLLEELAGAGLAIHGNIARFEKGLEGVDALESVKRLHEAMGQSLKRLQRMFEKKVDHDIFFAQGYYQGSTDTRESSPELTNALHSATIYVLHGGANGRR